MVLTFPERQTVSESHKTGFGPGCRPMVPHLGEGKASQGCLLVWLVLEEAQG